MFHIYQYIWNILTLIKKYIRNMVFDLKRFRRDFKLKQSELQDILGIPQSFISKIENGKEAFPTIHYDTLVDKYGEEALKDYVSEKTSSSTHQMVVGDGNITNTGVIGGGVSTMDDGELIDRVIELEKEVIRLNGEVSTRDATIMGLKNELAIRIEMITFLQNKK